MTKQPFEDWTKNSSRKNIKSDKKINVETQVILCIDMKISSGSGHVTIELICTLSPDWNADEISYSVLPRIQVLNIFLKLC